MAVAITRTADPAGVAASANVATYSSISIGTAAPDRFIVAVVTLLDASATIGSVSINNGAGARNMSGKASAKFGSNAAAIFIQHVPTGTTATFAVTFGAASPVAAGNHITIYSVTGASLGTAQNTNTSTDMDVTTPLSAAITIVTSGGAIAVASCATAGTTLKTWANITEDLEDNAGNYTHTTATRVTSGSVTITCTGTTNQEDGVLAWITFPPATAPPLSVGVSFPYRLIPYEYPLGLRTWTNNPPSLAGVVNYLPSRVTQWDVPSALVPPIATRWLGVAPPSSGVVVDTSRIPSRVVEWGSWPDPRVAMTWVRSPMFATTAVSRPVGNVNWQLPIRAARAPLTWTQAPIFAQAVAPPTIIPGRVVDWGTVSAPQRSALTWTQTPNFATPAAPPTFMPSRVTNWGQMWETPRKALTFVRGAAGQNVIVTPPTYIPGRVTDWGVTSARPPLVQTWTQRPPPREQYTFRLPYYAPRWPRAYFAYEVTAFNVALRSAVPAKPVRTDTAIVVPAARIAITWTQSLTPEIQTGAKPQANADTSITIPPARQAITWTQSLTPEIQTGLKPVVQSDWPLPSAGGGALPQSWIQTPPPTTVVAPPAQPVNQFEWQLPKAAAQGLPQTWIQTPLSAPTAPPSLPVNQFDWPLPKAAAQTLTGWTQGPPPTTVVAPPALPVNQYDWPVPTQLSRPAITWTQSLTPEIPSGAKPQTNADTSIVIPPARQAITWTQSLTPEISTGAMPVNNYDLSTPQRVSLLPTWFQFPNVALSPPIVVTPLPVNNFDGRLSVRATPFSPADLSNTLALLATPPAPKPINQYDWPVPTGAPRLASGYGFVFARNTQDMSPINMPPRVGVFGPPIGFYYPTDLRSFLSFPFQGVGPSAPSTGIIHNIPFIATMGGMTAR